MSEYGNVKGLERRYITQQIEFRNEGGKQMVKGYAATFGSTSGNNLPFIESVARGAFQRSINDPSNDCLALVNHDPNQILARRKNNTLSLREDGVGLYFEATLPNTSYANDLIENIKSRNIRGCSFSFLPVRQTWGKNGNGERTRSLDDVTLLDVSCVSSPCYEDTSVSVDDERFKSFDGGFDSDEDEDSDSDGDTGRMARRIQRTAIECFPGGVSVELRAMFAEQIYKCELEQGQSARIRRMRLNSVLQW